MALALTERPYKRSAGGGRDRAKCWYCSGSLQNWEYDDIPWIEHAKWFPNCQFLLRVKGQHFVSRHLAPNPKVVRPIMARQDGSPLESVGKPDEGAQAPRTPPSEPGVHSPPTIIDHQVQREDKIRIITSKVLGVGFTDSTASTETEDGAEVAGTHGDAGGAHENGTIAEPPVREEEREQSSIEMADPDHKSLCVVHQGKSFVVDTGSVRSFVPAAEASRSRPVERTFQAANGSIIQSYDRETVRIMGSDNTPYPYDFLVADVTEYIIGMDFLLHYKLLVDLENYQLYNRHNNSFIHCELSDGQPVSAILCAESSEINQLKEMVASICSHVQFSEQSVADEDPAIIVDPSEMEMASRERVNAVMRSSDLVKSVLAMGFDENIVAALLEDRINSGNVVNQNDIYESVGLLLDDVMKKEEELNKEEESRNQAAAAATPNPSLSGPNSFRTMSSLYSGVSSTSGMSSLGPSPGSGKYNVSYYGDEDEDERMNRDMYGSLEGSSASITSVTTAKRLHAAEENPESLREALNKIEEERMCKICFTSTTDMV